MPRSAPLRGHGIGPARALRRVAAPRHVPYANALTASRMRLHTAFAASGPLGPFATAAARPRLRLPGADRLRSALPAGRDDYRPRLCLAECLWSLAWRSAQTHCQSGAGMRNCCGRFQYTKQHPANGLTRLSVVGSCPVRGEADPQTALFSYVSLEARVPREHPLCKMRLLVDAVLASLDEHLASVYATRGRPSIPPEFLLRASLIQILYTVRSERQLVEQIEFNLLFRWFVGLEMDDRVWHHSTFSRNRERLFGEGMARAYFDRVKALAEWQELISDEHFSVDGSLIEAWASHKSFQPRDPDKRQPPTGGGRNAEADFRGQRCSNATHASLTDPDAQLYRKSDNTPRGALSHGPCAHGQPPWAHCRSGDHPGHRDGRAGGGAAHALKRNAPPRPRPWGRTRATTPPSSSPPATPWVSRPMWPPSG
jgi:transposase